LKSIDLFMQIFGNCSVYPEEKFILHNIMQISFLVDGALQDFIIFHEVYGQVGESHLKRIYGKQS